MKTRSQSRRAINDQQHLSALPDKALILADANVKDSVDGAVAVPAPGLSCVTNHVANPDKSHMPDAEASGRIVIREWDAIGQQGVFVGSTLIAAGEVLGTLQGVVIRRRRLTGAERRRFVGIRVNGRAAHIDVQGKWPEKVNHGPPCRSNADWDPETRLITATKDILPGDQVLFDYGVGYWVDELLSRDYDKLPKDQRAFFETMHAVVDNYAWLSHTIHQQKLSQAMRVGIIAFFLSWQCLGTRSINRLSTIDDVTSRVVVAVQDMNPLVQYLSDWGLAVKPNEPLHVRSGESANEASKAEYPKEMSSSQQADLSTSFISISATDAHAPDSHTYLAPSGDSIRHRDDTEVTERVP